MENWYAISQYEKARQKEIETEIRNHNMIRLARGRRKGGIGRAYRKALKRIGKYLETLGQALQKSLKHVIKSDN